MADEGAVLPTTSTAAASSPTWIRPTAEFHAHFDCFSGAAGDMLLAACLDASGRPEDLLAYVSHCLGHGIPNLKEEFSIQAKQVNRGGMGSIKGLYVKVHSKYQHAQAPFPARSETCIIRMEGGETEQDRHGHSHRHQHDHQHHHGKDDDHLRSQDHHDHVDPYHSPTHSGTTNNNTNLQYPLRNLPQIQELVETAPEKYLPSWVKKLAVATFTELAMAEAATHGASSIDGVYFHEVGAVDSIVDTVGTLLALYCLNVTSVSCSRLPIGEGNVWTAHGCLPVPAPATLRLLVDMPTCPGPMGVVTGELVTPTGAALLRALKIHCSPQLSFSGTVEEKPSCSFMKSVLDQGRTPPFTIRKIGIGAGTKDFEKHPNILRLLLGDNLIFK